MRRRRPSPSCTSTSSTVAHLSSTKRGRSLKVASAEVVEAEVVAGADLVAGEAAAIAAVAATTLAAGAGKNLAGDRNGKGPLPGNRGAALFYVRAVTAYS